MVPHVTDMKIRRFWTDKLTKVPSPSFRIVQVPRMKKKMKTNGAKNKVFKPEGAKKYLTLYMLCFDKIK
jgi:hypothetical protein